MGLGRGGSVAGFVPMPTIEANGIEMFYELAGQGEPLVLIGGLGVDSTFLRPLVAPLAERLSVLSFDNRGAGRSSKPDEPYTVELMAADTLALMDAVGLRHAHVLGVSMGASIALALALDQPRRVASLILVSASARKTMDMPVARPSRSTRLLHRLVPAAGGDRGQPDYAFQRQFVASRTYDCSSRLGEIHAPTLVMHARRDGIVPLGLAEELHAGIRGSRLETFDGDHVFFVGRERRRFLDETLRFLADSTHAQ